MASALWWCTVVMVVALWPPGAQRKTAKRWCNPQENGATWVTVFYKACPCALLLRKSFMLVYTTANGCSKLVVGEATSLPQHSKLTRKATLCTRSDSDALKGSTMVMYRRLSVVASIIRALTAEAYVQNRMIEARILQILHEFCRDDDTYTRPRLEWTREK